MGCSISAPKGAGVEQPVELNDERCGLFYGHAYSIIDYLDLYTKDKNAFNLMRVRNPWGHGEWALDWSDKPIDDNP
jgi:calpain